MTLFAVLVALFQERIKAELIRARLSVRVEPGISIPLTGSIPAHHYRLGITAQGALSADYVEVFVAKIWANGRPEPWWSPSPLGWSDGNKPYRELLSGRTTRLCDFLMMIAPGNTFATPLNVGELLRPRPAEFDFETKPHIRVMTAITPNGGLNILFPGRYVVELDVSAKNAHPFKHFIEVDFNGRWSSDPNDAILLVRIVDSPSEGNGSVRPRTFLTDYPAAA